MKKILLLSLVTAMDDQSAARALVPNGPNVKITSVHSTSADWTSFFGIVGNIIGLHSTTVSGTK